MELHPTLWRTCRVLAGETRLRLFRLIVNSPRQTVTRLAEQAGIGCSLASQELRRLQSRGLVRSERKGRCVRYLPESDPQVPEARLLLAAMKASFARSSGGGDKHARRIAAALSHPRRIAILRELRQGPRNLHALQSFLRIPLRTLYRHLQILQDGDLVHQTHRVFRVARHAHPLAKCLADLVRTPGKS